MKNCMVHLSLLVIILSGIDAAGFFNFNLDTLKTRASRITTDLSDYNTIQESNMPLSLYPDFKFVEKGNETLNKVFYVSELTMVTNSMCTSEDFSLGVWRLSSPNASLSSSTTDYMKVADLLLEQCPDYAYSFHIACCTYTVSATTISGDILGILHGPESSLLHEVDADPQLQPLFGMDPGSQTSVAVSATVDRNRRSRRGYPLLMFAAATVTNMLSYSLVSSAFTQLVTTPIQNFGMNARFSCEGKILSWHIGGIPLREGGNVFTLRLKRLVLSESEDILSVFTVNVTTITVENIYSTPYPNVYEINKTEAQFVFRRGDYISIVFDGTQDVNEFIWYSTLLEDVAVLNNVDIIDSVQGATTNFPLLSLEIASNTCPGHSAFYDPDVLADRALVIEDIQSAPLLPSNAEPASYGYLYVFPNLTFTEAGSIFQWRFGARVNDARSSQYPELQVWRGGDGENFTLVSTTSNNQDPSRVLAALNVYSYNVNLTYEAGDILALYQPPISTSKYLLSFISSRNYESQNLAHEIPFQNEKVFVQHVEEQVPLSLSNSSRTSTLVEPLLSILSTSTPNDSSITVTFGQVPFDGPIEPNAPVTVTTGFEMLVNVTDATTGVDILTATIRIGVVTTALLCLMIVVILGLILALCFTRRKYRKAAGRGTKHSQRYLSSRNSRSDSESYAVIGTIGRPSLDGGLQTRYHQANIQGYEEVPMPLPPRVTHETSPNFLRKQRYCKTGSANAQSPDCIIPLREGYNASSERGNPGRPDMSAYEVPTSTDNFQSGHNHGFQSHVLSVAQAYEVPSGTLGTSEVLKPESSSLEHSYENSDDIGIYDCEEEFYDDVLYVPTEKERSEGFNSISNLYYTIRENQRATAASTGDFFEESDMYWAPASNAGQLYQQMAEKKYREIPRHQIKQSVRLGAGQFGTVFKGLWLSSSSSKVEVAIKTLSNDVGEKERVKFLQEGAIIGQFQHPNVVKLHGMVTLGQPAMIILELLPNGDLHNFLNKKKANLKMAPNLPKLLLGFCQNIAAGMDYLSSKSFVHRDLAARNILLTENQTCKITDFGMSRDLAEEDYYISHGGMVPVKWTAPEAIMYRKYSTASDVWSFGVLVYEIWSLGCKPFAKLENIQVVKMVKKGQRLKPPPGCPREIYDTMMTCWNPESSKRPSFSELLSNLYKLELELRSRMIGRHKEFSKLGDAPESSAKLYQDLQEMYLLHN